MRVNINTLMPILDFPFPFAELKKNKFVPSSFFNPAKLK